MFLYDVTSLFLGSSNRIYTSSFGSSDLLVAGGCALVLPVIWIFDSGLSSPDLICCYAMSLRYVDLMSCGCATTVCLAAGFVVIFPFLRSPACSGCAGSCGFSSPIWLATFTMGSPLRGRSWGGPRSERRFGLFLFPFWVDSSR